MSESVSADTPASGDWRQLRTVPLLATLPEDQLRAMWADSVPRHYDAGEVVRHAGDAASHLLLLLRGRVVAATNTASGRVVRHGEWAAPCALDKVAVIEGRGHGATLTANTACTLRGLPSSRFASLIEDVPAVRTHVLRVLAGKVRQQRERWTATATLPAEARVASWLLERAATCGVPVHLPGTQQDLADLLGVTRVTANRALARLRRDGLIDLRGRTVVLLAADLLALRADG